MDLVDRSVRVILDSQYESGAYPASPTFSVYPYSWIRDGAFIAHAMGGEGAHESAGAFHAWVARTVERHREKAEAAIRERGASQGRAERGTASRERIEDRHVLHPRFTPEGEEVGGEWSNVQPDGWGLWLSAAAAHATATGRLPGPLRAAMELVASYLAATWDRPSASCWEGDDDRRHPTSLAAVAAGLRAAAGVLGDPGPAETAERVVGRLRERGTAGGSLARFEGSDEVDGSALLVLGPFGPFAAEDPLVAGTIERVERDLTFDGGVHRYRGDGYYGGGRWVLLSGALAWGHAMLGRTDRARDVLAWIERAADREGDLPEQVTDRLQRPERLREWEDRWGPVARPLLWAHAMYLIARRATEA